jgi:type IV pilus assembly protein PilF
MMRRAIYRLMNAALVVLAIAMLTGCTTSQSTTRKAAPSDDAGEQNFALGARYYRNGQYDLARDRLERALIFDARNADTHSLLALTLAQLGNHRLATESFDKAIRLAPNNPDVRNAYAVYLCRQQRYDEGAAQFEKAIRIRENDDPHVMMTNAGVCVAKKPDLARAEKYFRQALAVKPTYGEALIQMAALKHRTDDNFAARAFLQRYLGDNPATAGVLYLAVQVETQLGDDRAASDYMDQLLREFPQSAESRLLLQQNR